MLTPLPDASRYDQVAAHAFSHTAMACPWGIIILGGTARAAAHAARAAFEEVDRLEQELSRFIPHSDVARLNTHPVGEWLLLGPDCLDCLRIALRMHDQTLAAFDPTLGAAVDRHRTAVGPVSNRSLRDPDALGPVSNRSGTVGPVCNRSEQEIRESGPARPVENRSSSSVPGRLELDVTSRRARRLAEDVQIDLGALGKGYAIDCAAALLREWGVGSAAIHSGQSTVFAMVAAEADPPWRVALRDPDDPECEHGHVELRNAALSGSAMRIRGRHIIDPRTGRPAEGPRAAWCKAPSAAESDALSTAFMILPRDSVRACVAAAPGRRAWLLREHLETDPSDSVDEIGRILKA